MLSPTDDFRSLCGDDKTARERELALVSEKWVYAVHADLDRAMRVQASHMCAPPILARRHPRNVPYAS